jgi:hypothetical protein
MFISGHAGLTSGSAVAATGFFAKDSQKGTVIKEDALDLACSIHGVGNPVVF